MGAPDALLDFYEDQEKNEVNIRAKLEFPVIPGAAQNNAIKAAELKKEAYEAKQALIRSQLDPEQLALADAADAAALVARRLLNIADTHAGNTALHEACQHGHFEAAKLLISRGCAVDRKNFLGRTPLACAAANNVDETVQ
jgi:ankyrin repeat protein